MAYRHNDALHKHKVRARRVHKSALIFSGVLALIALFIGVDWVVNQVNNTETVVSGTNTKSVQSVNVSVYRTEYFQFQAPESWVEVASESSEKRFVYVKNNGSLITQKLTVMVDRPELNREADFKLTRVLPVSPDGNDGFVTADNVSEHCNDSFPAEIPRNPTRIDHANVSFVCAPSSQQYNVVIGESGGSDSIPITLKDGREATLFIVYSDLTAYPSPGDIYNIISSFSTL